MKKNYKAWNINFNDFYGKKTIFDQLGFLIKFAVLAPSSHNNQPWKFSIKNKNIFLYPNDSSWLPISDPDHRNFFISLGCALENLLIAADYYGLKAKVTYLPAEDTDAAARINLEFPKNLENCNRHDNKHLAVFIPERCTNRNKYLDKQIPQELMKQIKSFSDEDIEVSIISDQDKKNRMSKIMLDSRVKIFDNKLFRQELSKYKKNNWTRSPVGITGVTMGFNTPMSFMAPTVIKYVNVMRPIRKKEETLLKKHTPLFVIVSAKENVKRNWLKSGRIFERSLLVARQHNVHTAISAFSSTTEIEQVQEILNTKYFPQIFIRAGYANKIPPHSPRLRAEEVIN